MRLLLTGLLFTVACITLQAVQIAPLQLHLEKQLRTWQKRLKMEEWNLTIQVVRKSALDKDTWGNAEWDSEAKTGVISLLDPLDYNLKGSDLRRDMECTIVHELVHIQVSPLSPENPEAQENIVNNIVVALLNKQCPN